MPNNVEVHKLIEFIGHQHPIYSLSAAPLPGRFFSAGGDRMIVEWDIQNPEMGQVLAQLPATIYSLCLLDDNQILVAGTSTGGIHFINIREKKELHIVEIKGEGIFKIRELPAAKLLIASTEKGNLIIMDSATMSVKNIIPVANEKIRDFTFQQSAKTVFVACSDGRIFLVNIETGEITYQWDAHTWACHNIIIDEINNRLISASKDAHIRVWDLSNFQLIKSIPAHNYAIYQIQKNPDYPMYASASRDKTIKLWNDELDIIIRLDHKNHQGHLNSVNAILWLNKNILISSGDDKRIMSWEIKMN